MSSGIESKKEILVSICCVAYNQEKYIGKCLDSFVSQKTDFAFEVLIHDDASTDRTAEIIRTYEQQYPDIVKPIYQTVNQYSQGVNIAKEFQHPRVSGKYVALCEGDDYWCDENKLQTQVEYMEQHEDCTMTCCAIQRIDGEGNFTRIECVRDEEGDLETKDVIEQGGYYISTPSIVLRKSVYVELPRFREMADVGDFPLQILAAARGKVHYFPKPMAAWRIAHEGSWSFKQNQKVNVGHFYCEDEWLREFDRYFDYKFHEAVLNRLVKWSKKYAIHDPKIEEMYHRYLEEQIALEQK